MDAVTEPQAPQAAEHTLVLQNAAMEIATVDIPPLVAASPRPRCRAQRPLTISVTGGTGAYAGARGTLTSSNGRDTLTLQ